jgi:hypothetical protein
MGGRDKSGFSGLALFFSHSSKFGYNNANILGDRSVLLSLRDKAGPFHLGEKDELGQHFSRNDWTWVGGCFRTRPWQSKNRP